MSWRIRLINLGVTLASCKIELFPVPQTPMEVLLDI